MNGIQATMLAATAAPVEASLVLSNRNSKGARDCSLARGNFEKQLQRACQGQGDSQPRRSEVQEKSEPMKAEEGSSQRDNQVEQPKAQSSEAGSEENQYSEKAGEGNNGKEAQTDTSSIAQVVALPFIGLVKVETTIPMQQGVLTGAGGADESDVINPKIQMLSSNDLEVSQLYSQVGEGANNAKSNSSVVQPAKETNPALFVVNDNNAPAAEAETDTAGKTAAVESQIPTAAKPGTHEEKGRLNDQFGDEFAVKKTAGDASGAPGRKMAEFESQRVSVIRPDKEISVAESQQQSQNGSQEESNSLLQQVEVEVPKVHTRSVPSSVQNSRAVVDPQDLMDQVVKKAEVMIRDNSSEMTLQLKPGFLGKMTIKIAVDEAGTVTAHFSTSSQQVKNALEQNIQTLRQSLEAQGMKVDRTEVNVQLDSGGMMNDPGGRQDLWQQPRGNPFVRFSDSEGESIPAASQPVNPVQTIGYETQETSDGYNFLI